MEHTKTRHCGQAGVQDAFRLDAVRDDAGRKALFARMCREGLTVMRRVKTPLGSAL